MDAALNIRVHPLRKTDLGKSSVHAGWIAHTVLLLTLLSSATYCRAENVISVTETGVNVTRHVSIGLNKTLIVELPQDAHDIVVSDPGVSDAIVRATRTIFLFGKKVGE
jgi:pilus assembly protein CpaC